ncbi:HsdM family class I SAM-dependent methyltransferase [Clostridium tertium]|uniref:HsdM family class I SAM-dependent methyltransferase n=1 Tax=Clostridium tertium TaxID=1559 RepID=UPI003561AD68
MSKIIEVINIDKVLYVNEFNRNTVVEKIVDREVGNILEKDFGREAVFQDKVESNGKISKEYANKINSLFNSKGEGNRAGKPDYIVVTNQKDSLLEMLVDNKNSNESIENGLNDAIFYANSAIAKGFDVRIALASNGKESVFRVYNLESKEWVPFTIDGMELKGIPNKTLVDLIYKDNAIGIKEDYTKRIRNSQIIRNVLDELDEIYYARYNYLSQNKHNELKIDFTIANVVLQTLLEKYKSIFQETDVWDDIKILYEIKENYTNKESRDIKKGIKACMDVIFNSNGVYDEYESIFKQYQEVFVVKDMKNKRKTLFNYKVLIDDIGSIDEKNKNKTLTADIYKQFARIETLHDSDIDLFGEIYEKLMNNKTKKDFGQFFTKRNLTSILAKLLFKNEIKILVNEYISEMDENFENKNFNEILIDFACGTGGLITEVMHLIRRELRDGEALNKLIKEKNLNFSNKQIYVDKILKEMCKRCVYACDIAGENVARTKVNIFFAGDGYKKVDEIDSLNDDELNSFLGGKRIRGLITNIPMGSKTDTVIEFDGQKVSNKKISENQFLVQSVKYLKPGVGKAMIIVPDGILEGTENYELREWLIKHCKINGIVGFPKHSFAPYTHEKTYAIFIERRSVPLDNLIDSNEVINPVLISEEGIYMYIVDCDGFANSDKRFVTDLKDESGKWKHNELSEWVDVEGKVYPSLLEECWVRKDSEQKEDFISRDEWDKEIEGKKYGIIKYSDILSNKIITRGSIVKKLRLNMEFCKEVGLYKEVKYNVNDLVKLYTQGVEYIIDAINSLGFIVDKERKYEYIPIKISENIEFKSKKVFEKYLIENEVFGHREFKFKFNFKESNKIEVIDLKTNTSLYEKTIEAMLNMAGISIEHKEITSSKAKSYIMNSDRTIISDDELNKINEYISNNYEKHELEFTTEQLSYVMSSFDNEDALTSIIEEINALGYEVENLNSGYKFYNQVEKRIVNLLPETYLRPVVTKSLSLDEFLISLSELGIIDSEDINKEKEEFIILNNNKNTQDIEVSGNDEN